MPRIGQERLHRPARSRSPQLIDALSRCEIGFHHGDVGAETAKAVSSGLNLWSIGCH